MFERFTQAARETVVGAQLEARTLGHPHIGTEHLLLGILREEHGPAARLLAEAHVDTAALRTAVENELRPAA